MPAAITTLAQLGVGTNNATPASIVLSTRLDFVDFNMGIEQEFRDLNGTRGKLSKDGNRVRPNLIHVAPRIRTQPTCLELETLLPWIMGGGTGTAPMLQNAAPLLGMGYDFGLAGGNAWFISGCAVDEATFSASSGEPLDVSISCLGQSYAVGQTFTSGLYLDVTTQPFMFIDTSSGINVNSGGANVTIKDFSLTIANGLDRGRFLNSQTLTILQKLNRRITCSFSVPYGFYTSYYGLSLTSLTQPSKQSQAVSLVATYMNGGSALQFTINDLRIKPVAPDVVFQQENFIRMEGEAYMDPSGSSQENESLLCALTLGP
jgi:hypothetical protein